MHAGEERGGEGEGDDGALHHPMAEGSEEKRRSWTGGSLGRGRREEERAANGKQLIDLFLGDGC